MVRNISNSFVYSNFLLTFDPFNIEIVSQFILKLSGGDRFEQRIGKRKFNKKNVTKNGKKNGYVS